MRDSGILQQAIKFEKVNRQDATHFALCNGDKVRYLIALKGGKKRLRLNISTYSGKLTILMKILNFIPFYVFLKVKLGYFVNAKLHPAVEKHFLNTKSETWNLIVGTYDEKQKLVLQCFDSKRKYSTFIKVGNKTTGKEMLSEIKFLQKKQKYQYFKIPEILSFEFISDQCPFNIQTTKEFLGDKVEPVLTKEIVCIYKEIAGEKQIINGAVREFSHGDFAPWNIKKNDSDYTVFDWEHCEMRMKGFDLMHFATIIEMVVNRQPLENAVNIGLENILKIDPSFEIDKQDFLREFGKLRLEMR